MTKISCRCLLIVVLLLGANAALAQWVEQTLSLQPGWNAVFLEVQPAPADCDTLFAGLPVESVWDFNRPADAPQFVQDPTTLIPGAPGWLTWFPMNHPLAGQGNLFILRDGRPYLIKLEDSTEPVNLIVKGKPSLRTISWHAGGLNFVGFHVGAQGPTFQSLFSGESGLAGQPVYTLGNNGVWQLISNLATARPVAGRAYWVRCALPASRTASIQLDAGVKQGIHFASGAAELSLRVRNTSAANRNVSVRVLASAASPAGQPPLAGPVPLEYYRANYAAADFSWQPLDTTLSFTALAPKAEWNIRLGARRNGASPAPGAVFQSLLEVTDDLGTRWLIPVTADGGSGAAAAAPAASLTGASLQGPSESLHAGLWVGEALLNAVSQPAATGNPTLPRPAGGQMTFRLIVHVDSGGTARLLQHVYLVRKPPTFVPDPANPGYNKQDQPARTVLFTDESQIAGVVGAGEILGRRISSAAFGFKDPQAMTGGEFGAGTLTVNVVLDYDHPLNPFLHVYHPDHDNLDERFEQMLPEGRESFTVGRMVSLEFTGTDSLGLNPPGWGDSEIGGNYRETISGIHRMAIQVSGTFRLVRVARTSSLNDGQDVGLANGGLGIR